MMSYSNNTSNASSDTDVRELGPFDVVYSVAEFVSVACLAIVIVTYILTK